MSFAKNGNKKLLGLLALLLGALTLLGALLALLYTRSMDATRSKFNWASLSPKTATPPRVFGSRDETHRIRRTA